MKMASRVPADNAAGLLRGWIRAKPRDATRRQLGQMACSSSRAKRGAGSCARALPAGLQVHVLSVAPDPRPGTMLPRTPCFPRQSLAAVSLACNRLSTEPEHTEHRQAFT